LIKDYEPNFKKRHELLDYVNISKSNKYTALNNLPLLFFEEKYILDNKNYWKTSYDQYNNGN